MDAIIALMLIEAVLILLAIAISKAIRLISPLDDSCKDVVDSIPTVSSSHIIVAPPATKYDVFLSFRGEDTRDNFSSYLYKALCDANIQTFMDHKLHKGEHIAPLLLKTIEEAEISLIIFSKDYASSTWCMDELVHIMKCQDKYRRVVIPIFYHVDPSNIHKQNGSFGDGFAKLKQRFKHNQEKVQEWKNALIQSTKLSGWDSKNIRPEPKLIKKIVTHILSKLNGKSSFHVEGLVGIDHRIQKIEELLRDARIVGIWGMGGIGKTTLARAVFHKLKAHFDAFSFVETVKEQLARITLDELQKKCLVELLKDENINAYNLKSTFVKSRLHRKKILLILDDVDNSIIAEDLTKVCDWFGKGSRIIITSRDMQVLKNASAFSTYHVLRLNFDDSFLLFSLKAFKRQKPSKSYIELSKSVVDYCKGNPLALIVLGCFLYRRGKKEWESALDKLNQAPPKDIVDVLKLSFDGLDDKQQNVFLDLAFLIKENVHNRLNLIRQLYGSSVHIEICVLRERSLISDYENGSIGMHDLVRQMGFEIARQQLLSSPKTPVRLWRHEDIYDYFICDKGLEAIRCMSLDASKIKRIILRASNFRKMHNLIFLKVYKSNKRKSQLDICEDLDYLSEELRVFSWEEYPQPYMPLHFSAENLITLEMQNSNIRQLWNGYQHFPNLKEIFLSGSKDLIALPDLSHTPKIELMYLIGCVNLAQIHSSTVPGKNVQLCVDFSGPVQTNIGGSIKGTSSGLVFMHNYLDLRRLSFNKVTMKLFVHGKIISGVRFKHVVMPLAKIAELRKGTQSLASLLPFVKKLHWIEIPIEFGEDFKQHYTYDPHYAYSSRWRDFSLIMKVKCDRGERSVLGPLRREMINDNEEWTPLMEVEEEEEELMTQVEYCCSKTTNILTGVPNSITRWSLLTQLTLKESDIIGNAGCSIAQVSILKSLIALSHDDYCRRIKPLSDVKLSFDIPPSALRDFAFNIRYHLDDVMQQRTSGGLGSLWFGCYVDNYGSLYPNYDLMIEFEDYNC